MITQRKRRRKREWVGNFGNEGLFEKMFCLNIRIHICIPKKYVCIYIYTQTHVRISAYACIHTYIEHFKWPTTSQSIFFPLFVSSPRVTRKWRYLSVFFASVWVLRGYLDILRVLVRKHQCVHIYKIKRKRKKNQRSTLARAPHPAKRYYRKISARASS